ncbi:MAG TPA: bifunctional serine/threonine-protein kinase/formylglycine-generating enzyme family protein [Polyangiaceae bacterium]|nr:bifunctional serine/threonine-protein kinase/formylglycine-generating enzyme family protein [Polyangiaceae bacterium]
MSKRRGEDDETPLGPTELAALRRLAEPSAQLPLPQPEDLWAARYRIVESIGKGGMGEVFLARDVLLERLVALKVLRSTSDESFVDERRLLREARAAASAEHERIARVYDVGTWKDQAFIAMEYVRGETLRVWMKTYRPTKSETVAIVQQLLEGLHALHERGLVHRDLKPENVMVTPEGSLRILDLGIAGRVAISDVTNQMAAAGGSVSLGFGVGTPGYMAPEQWRGTETDARADLFALGVVAFELIAGRPPFRGSTNREIRDQTLHAELTFEGPEWADTPAALTASVRTALARDPNERFEDVPKMAEALAQLFRPVPPPLSGRRAPTIRPPGDSRPIIESLGASTIGTSIRVLAKKRPTWLALSGILVVSFVFAARSRWLIGRARATSTSRMAHLAGGTYAMGLSDQQVAEACKKYPMKCDPIHAEGPPRPVTVAPFDLDVHEVTNEEFAKFLMNIGPSLRIVADIDEHYLRFVRYSLRQGDDFVLYDGDKASGGIELSLSGPFKAKPTFERLPVTQVSWLGARLYCKDQKKRLPTESEWELAARGLDDRPFPWGREDPVCKDVHIPSHKDLSVRDPAGCDNQRVIPFPVMSAQQDVTPEGIFDMGGNVVEWVDDDAQVNDDEASYSSRLSEEKPVVVRGGAFNSSFLARPTARFHRLAFNVARNLGFRCARSISSN